LDSVLYPSFSPSHALGRCDSSLLSELSPWADFGEPPPQQKLSPHRPKDVFGNRTSLFFRVSWPQKNTPYFLTSYCNFHCLPLRAPFFDFGVWRLLRFLSHTQIGSFPSLMALPSCFPGGQDMREQRSGSFFSITPFSDFTHASCVTSTTPLASLVFCSFARRIPYMLCSWHCEFVPGCFLS